MSAPRQSRKYAGAPGIDAASGFGLKMNESAPKFRKRSEERRVGKECRSLCDWSSDVCSSDLDVGAAPKPQVRRRARNRRCERIRAEDERVGAEIQEEIGRASCRERV